MDTAARRCAVCGGGEFRFAPVLWDELVAQWQLAPHEAHYINRQQGEICTGCGANLRSIALAAAICTAAGSAATLTALIDSRPPLRLLEINAAGTLHPLLRRLPGHVFGAYPDVDMHALPWPDGAFDLVVHSDTLEHVANPVHALGECRRVLAPGGALCFTVPVVVGRLTRSRDGLAPSYHGAPGQGGDDLAVQMEFGADAWTYPMQAGFTEVRLHAFDYPAAIAMSARA